MNRSMRGIVTGLAAAVLLASLGAGAADAARRLAGGARPFGGARPTAAQLTSSDRRIDVNQLNMFVTNTGSSAFDFANQDAGLFYPRGTTKSAVFAAGLWIGGKVGSDIRVALAEYSQEYSPGAILSGGAPDDPNRPEYVVYKVVRLSGSRDNQGRLVDTLRVDRTAEELAGDPFMDPIAHHSWAEYRQAIPYGAPWRLYRLPDDSTPAPDDSVDVPGPDVLGDQMLWCVYNDADPAQHANDAGSTNPLGLEVQQTTFAFDRQGALGLTLFVKYKIINKSGGTIDSMFVSQWSDPDLGGAAGFTDDLVGCDTLPDGTGKPRSLGYVYNSTNNDGGYGSTPPALGYDFFQGPLVGTTRLGLVSFNKYINGTDPQNANQTFNYMKGLTQFGDVVVDPFGVETRYIVAGDPVSPGPGSWLDSAPADRRLLMSSGPFTMAAGDTQEVVVACIVGQGADRLSSISALRFNDEFAQDAFDKAFDLPSPPPQPRVNATVDHGVVTLAWDTGSRTNYNEPGYAFQGYVVYQGETRSGPWRRLIVYDEIDNVRVIRDAVFDVTLGQTILDYPVAFGSDAGVRYTHSITQDVVRGAALYDGTEYYFAVTAYAYNPTGLPKVLENAQAVVTVVPQRAAGGTDRATASATSVTHVLREPKAPATDLVTVEVVTPELITGHIYKVAFAPTNPLFSGIVGTDTATVRHSWSLIDSTNGNSVLYSGQLNRRGDEDYLVTDGLRVKVTGKYFPAFQEAAYRNLDGAHRRPIAEVNWGGEAFGGGAGFGYSFFGGTLDPTVVSTDSFTTVQLRFNGTQKAYRFLRLEVDGTGAPPPQGRSYLYGGYVDVPFQIWDATNDRQLEGAFVERCFTDAAGTILPPASQPATFDSTWAPDESGLGGREYLFVFSYAYAGVAKEPDIGHDAAVVDDSQPIMYALWSHLRAASDVFDPADQFEFVFANPATDNDVYVFSTQALQRSNSALAKNNLERIRAVPNPYYARSNYELDQFTRRLRFMNLPERCTIRLYNLAGQLVRTLQKTDATTSILTWDLQTTNQLPVGSGIYIFHVDAPGVGTYTGRVVVFFEKERLNSF